MANVGKVQGTTVSYYNNGNVTTKKFQSNQPLIFEFNTKPKSENFYKSMSLETGMLTAAAKFAEPQGEAEEAKAAASATVGNNNGTTIIIIGDGNKVHVGGADKAEDPDAVEATEDTENPDEVEDTEEPEEAKEQNKTEDPNKKVIDTLKEVIRKLLDLVGLGDVTETEPTEETQAKDEAPTQPEEPKTEDANKKIIDTLKKVIVLLLDLIQYQEPKKVEDTEAKNTEEKEDKTEKAAA